MSHFQNMINIFIEVKKKREGIASKKLDDLLKEMDRVIEEHSKEYRKIST